MGPGATNAATGIASAFADRSPMVCVIFQVETDKQRLTTHQYLDLVAFLKPISKDVLQAESVTDIAPMVSQAFKTASEEVPGSVVIILPINLLLAELELQQERNEISTLEPLKEPEDLSFLDLINNSKRPILLAGGGAVRCNLAEDIACLAEKLNIPVASTLGAKGILPENSPYSLGCVNRYLNFFVQPSLADRVFEETDLLILVGYDEAEDLTSDLWGKDKKTLLITFNNLELIGEQKPSAVVSGDPHKILRLITEKVKRFEDNRILRIVKTARESELASPPPPDENINLWQIHKFMSALNDSVSPESYICVDVGMNKHASGILFEAKTPYRNIYSNGLATMGFGLPAGMGAALAHPERKTVVICGDGGFHSTSQDLETCARYNLNMVIFVLVNNDYSLIRYYQHLGNSPVIESGLTNFGYVDFPALARANGCKGVKLQTLNQLKDILRDNNGKTGPILVEVPIDYEL
jgi:acetolactate synthase-1/2/3 large subunit/N2-(2-carboxyethyl)arginine synthase